MLIIFFNLNNNDNNIKGCLVDEKTISPNKSIDYSAKKCLNLVNKMIMDCLFLFVFV
jgi:hypothetical protein